MPTLEGYVYAHLGGSNLRYPTTMQALCSRTEALVCEKAGANTHKRLVSSLHSAYIHLHVGLHMCGWVAVLYWHGTVTCFAEGSVTGAFHQALIFCCIVCPSIAN
eukprot:COSAG02_NODE_181_length_30783_cov_53.060520_21_plen_105_part_00